MPVDYSIYPHDWRDRIRPAILKRDGYKCKKCGVRQRAKGYRDDNKKFIECDSFMQNWATVNGKKIITIYLSIAHLDHDIRNNEFSNLWSMCQQCHNQYDAKNRKLNRLLKRDLKGNNKFK